MKRQSLSYFVALPALLLALSAQAHDPKEHMKEAQAPDCAAMKDMDHSKMDMKDPVMQAMMKKVSYVFSLTLGEIHSVLSRCDQDTVMPMCSRWWPSQHVHL